jgi:hypothetical protein
MAYLYGRQGSGKTSFMKWFLGPVETGMVVTDFSIFGHDETKSLLRTTPVIFFDEMEKADKADLARVKNMMTSSTAVFRRIFGAATKAPIMSTFFGAGDRDLSQVLNDPAGLRRFFQIEVKPDLFEHLGELFERINPVDLWRAVDENGPCPIETGEIVALLRETTRRSPTPVTEWIAEKVEEGGWAEFRDEKNLFREFSQWKRAYFPGDRTNLFKFRADLERISKSGVFSMDGRSTQTGHMEYNIETTASDNVATSFETDEFRPIRGQKPKRVVIEYW